MLLDLLGSLGLGDQLNCALKVADLPFVQSHIERPKERSETIGAVTVGQEIVGERKGNLPVLGRHRRTAAVRTNPAGFFFPGLGNASLAGSINIDGVAATR